jgi:hypothetical protein
MLNFLGIGAQKAGTTWLFQQLQAHPGISFPGGKEVHFWDVHRHRGVDWYRGLFRGTGGGLEGDITPAYAILEPAVIAECHAAFPHLRLIYTLRNPLERAWSAAKMEVRHADRQLADTSDDWLLEQCHDPGSIARGDYETCIRNWLRAYPRESLLILRFEELVNSPSTYLAKCFAHLGVAATVGSDAAALRGKACAGHPEPIRPALRPVLRDLYAEKIRGLAEYLGQDFSAWLE